jgi:phosphohistidine phosphatase
MRRLLLMRHAKSSWDQPGLADIDRPLAPRGRSSAKAMARQMRRDGLRPDLVLCSPAARVRETWELLSEELGQDLPCRTLRSLYPGVPSRLLAALSRAGDDVASLLLIGHNPGISSLALRLARPGAGKSRKQMETKFPTAALAVLAFKIDRWSEIEPETGRLVAFVRPKDLS